MGIKTIIGRIILVIICLSIAVPFFNASAGVGLNYQYQPTPSQEEIINVLAIRQPDNEMVEVADQLSSNYLAYGDIRIQIDYTTAATAEVTLSLLEDKAADVLYLPNLYEGDNLLSESEIGSIRAYVGDGHGIVGSHGTLEPSLHASLGPYFGISEEMISSTGTGGNLPIVGYSQIFDLSKSTHPIFDGVNDDYVTESIATMAPMINNQQSLWTEKPEIIIDDAKIIATSTDQLAAIIVYEEDSIDLGIFRSVYLTHYPSQGPILDDFQLLYNSFLWAGWKTNDVGVPEETSSKISSEIVVDVVTTDRSEDDSSRSPTIALSYNLYFSIIGLLFLVMILNYKHSVRRKFIIHENDI